MAALHAVLFVATFLLGFGIYILTLYLAYLTSFLLLLFTLIAPGIAQLVWIWNLWTLTGTFFNFYTSLCLAWLALLALTFLAGLKAQNNIH